MSKCTEQDVNTFITTHKLDEESLYDVCRGHDMLQLLSLTLVDVQTYSEKSIMNKMIEAYDLNDFRATRLYASILTWQTSESVNALVA